MNEEELDNLEVGEEENQEIDETPEKDNSHKDKEARYKEQLKGSREEAERLRNLMIEREVKAAEKDAMSLLELHDTDPKLANEVAKKFGYDDFEDAKSEIDKKFGNSEGISKMDDVNFEERFEKMYQERKAKEEHENALLKAKKILNKIKDESVREQATKKFERLVDGRKLTIDSAEEFAEMATLYVNKDNLRENKYEEGLGDYASTGLGMGKKGNANGEGKKPVVIGGRIVYLDTNKQ